MPPFPLILIVFALSGRHLWASWPPMASLKFGHTHGRHICGWAGSWCCGRIWLKCWTMLVVFHSLAMIIISMGMCVWVCADFMVRRISLFWLPPSTASAPFFRLYWNCIVQNCINERAMEHVWSHLMTIKCLPTELRRFQECELSQSKYESHYIKSNFNFWDKCPFGRLLLEAGDGWSSLWHVPRLDFIMDELKVCQMRLSSAYLYIHAAQFAVIAQRFKTPLVENVSLQTGN